MLEPLFRMIGLVFMLSIWATFGLFILWWRIVRPNPLVRIPVSLVLIGGVAIVIAMVRTQSG